LLFEIITAIREEESISQRELAKRIGVSQQTVSRILRKLEDMGYIERKPTSNGSNIKVLRQGILLIERNISYISEFFKKRGYRIKLVGRVVSGLGEGKYYLSLPYYKESFKKYLGFDVYPGTLNVALESRYLNDRLELDTTQGILIPRYADNLRTYGEVKAFLASINGLEPSALIIPFRTSHPKSIIEVISPYYLREKLSLKDGDKVEIEVLL
jgi:riboflavin kinase